MSQRSYDTSEHGKKTIKRLEDIFNHCVAMYIKKMCEPCMNSAKTVQTPMLSYGGAYRSYGIWIICIACILGASAAVMYWLYSKMQKNTYYANNERVPKTTAENKQASLMFFFATWCPACKQAKPSWNEIKDLYDNAKVNGYTITCEEYDCSNQETSESITSKYKVEAFPTLMLYKDGEYIRYDASFSVDNMETFVKTNTA